MTNVRHVLMANMDWAINELPNAPDELELSIRRGERPAFRLVYIAKQRDVDLHHGWNWCKACNVEVPVRHRHQNVARCPSCLGRFVEVHEGTVANERIQNDPTILYKAYHDLLSAVWHEWTLRRIDNETLPDGALAFDVTPYELPTRSVCTGSRHLTRRERRSMARRGRRGRRGSVRVAVEQKTYAHETFEHEVIREMKAYRVPITNGPFLSEWTRGDIVEYRPKRFGAAMRICELCCCEVRVLVTMYMERSAPHLESLIKRGITRAVQRLGVVATDRALCLCKNGNGQRR